ncbi:hypothetical protein VTN96DRAFT_10212 [Rasamsonia emersonii]|uniref:thioredoxin-dependent peroxiredoxin n=1 Tax=Rasamsonia emersonii (strain ATCC 16479 / CBS 393.64 / IMI 116815) TaxID=1408163 RepID=A0A0F4YP03_RASE3|nr:Peroxiredoxin [Rasamsonia emersonii CBS 393.64]KKA19974.1 Peroxiredoxin [Rasamsonia emersonii CBS 393.64]
MVELRKRKAPSDSIPAQEKKAKPNEKKAPKERSAEPKKQSDDDHGPSPRGSVPKAGDTLPLDGFGGEIETHEGVTTSLKALIDASKSGVVLFTYPKASTPGCTKQACMFRDAYDHLSSTGLSIYGLSTDSPKANTTFKTKQNLPYPLLCDPKATLIAALGLKKVPKGTIRGVCVIDKTGKIRLLEPGSPAATVEAVERLVSESSNEDPSKELQT